MKDKKQTDLTAVSGAATFAFEMGMELLKPALENREDELRGLMKKCGKGLITKKETFDRIIKLRKKA